jgi:hypothetical protein
MLLSEVSWLTWLRRTCHCNTGKKKTKHVGLIRHNEYIGITTAVKENHLASVNAGRARTHTWHRQHPTSYWGQHSGQSTVQSTSSAQAISIYQTYHFNKEAVEQGFHRHSLDTDQAELSDLFTKPVPRQVLETRAAHRICNCRAVDIHTRSHIYCWWSEVNVHNYESQSKVNKGFNSQNKETSQYHPEGRKSATTNPFAAHLSWGDCLEAKKSITQKLELRLQIQKGQWTSGSVKIYTKVKEPKVLNPRIMKGKGSGWTRDRPKSCKTFLNLKLENLKTRQPGQRDNNYAISTDYIKFDFSQLPETNSDQTRKYSKTLWIHQAVLSWPPEPTLTCDLVMQCNLKTDHQW